MKKIMTKKIVFYVVYGFFCKSLNFYASFPRRRESNLFLRYWIPACAGMTKICMRRVLYTTILSLGMSSPLTMNHAMAAQATQAATVRAIPMMGSDPAVIGGGSIPVTGQNTPPTSAIPSTGTNPLPTTPSANGGGAGGTGATGAGAPPVPARAIISQCDFSETANVRVYDKQNPDAKGTKLTAAEISKCATNGGDPAHSNRQIQPLSQSLAVGGGTATGDYSNPTQSRTEGGYLPAVPSGLTQPDVLMKDVRTAQFPCGASASLSSVVLQAIPGTGSIVANIPPAAKAGIDALVNQFLGITPGAECQGAQLFALINAVSLIIQNNGSKGGFTYNMQNGTFLVPKEAALAFPKGSQLIMDLSASNSKLNLPMGGSFTDANGKTVVLPQKTSVQFQMDGNVITSTGQMYKVKPQAVVAFTPNGLIGVPDGTNLPIPPTTTLYPARSMVNAPDWVTR
jgi:hypothetical protein